ncbi:YdcF family protein [Amaricoccus macauensis]|uniref:YdcF family protein n=1 Tax=Amaricoccus macauensis TaxID=57001 RepID=UPI003C7DA538
MKAASVQLPRPFRPLLWLCNALLIVVLLFVLTGAGVVAHALWLTHVDTRPGTASVIVVLGGGVLQDGAPGPDTRDRLNHGITLYEEGLAPRMHFTGGHGNPNLPGLGSAMAEVAIAAGVPAEAITVEDASRSTLQNALLSRAPLPPEEAGPVILVSDGYHLGRAWASFRWAGYHPVEVSAATAFGKGSFRAQARRVARESLAWSFNVGRLGVWLTLNALGYEQSDTSDLLAGEPHAMILSA